jgi:hypothetical protein
MSRLISSGLADGKLPSDFLQNAGDLYLKTYLNLVQDDWMTIHELSIYEWEWLYDIREYLLDNVRGSLTNETIMSTYSLVSTISIMIVRPVSQREMRLVEISYQNLSLPITGLQQRVLNAIRKASFV